MGLLLRIVATAAAAGVLLAPTQPAAAQASPADGYWLMSIDGGVFSFGAPFHGSVAGPQPRPGGIPASCTIAAAPEGFEAGPHHVCTDIASTPSGGGYWVVDSFCHVFPFGDAGFFGERVSTRDLRDAFGDCQVTPTATGLGYWLSNDGGDVFAFGDARHHGDLVGDPGNPSSGVPGVRGAVVALLPTATGGGYWLVSSEGGVFSFGDAPFHGSLGGVAVNGQIVGAEATSTGGGYWLVATDGGVFSFGDARFFGSMGGRRLNQSVWDMAATPTGAGYWLVATDGGVFSVGDAPFRGSMGGRPLNNPVVAITARSA
jgi:hypothetical protein